MSAADRNKQPVRSNSEITVLAVDDEESILSLFKDALLMEGFKVITTTDSYLAIQHVAEKDISIVFTDLFMPELDGFEILKRIRILNPALPVFFMTGKGSLQSIAEAERAGISGYIVKPFKIEDVISLIHKLLQK